MAKQPSGNKLNWTEGAGSTQDKQGDSLTAWPGKPGAGETGGIEPGSSKPAHLASDTTLQGYITDVQNEYMEEYTEMFGADYHGGDNYPSAGSKSKQGMD